ncbi:polyketide synthase [Penicillium verrucosum]|uniref:polyketide synthase n=1 Tax=Penicillium verrucosum TaxID=60171 RepID=UPI002545A7D6|nr:polyketide synthase [Penicillium verrucosum]KAJ5945154.1 polyketide synthase [Penicillium verrucosum]
MDLLDIVKLIVNSSLPIKVFVLTKGVSAGQLTALAQSPLQGLSRIIASEHSDIWGALIDLEEPTIPLEVMKYVQGEGVICNSDGIPRIARLRPLPHNRLLPSCTVPRICRPEGTYLITGGLGTLGMETAEFLVEQGVRRVVLLSRRAVPPRKDWPAIIAESAPMMSVLKGIQRLEAYGATIKTIDIDITDESSAEQLSMALDAFNLPAVSGVIHAADLRRNVASSAFPPGTLDFMIFFSSCGQLFGFPGQASYASGNAFLDTLAAHRRNQGDNAVSLQWSSWRGMGMATSNEFINAELANKGITDITRDEAFQALLHVLKYDISQAAVLRSLPIEDDEPIPSSILTDIIKRKPPTSSPSDKPPSETKEGNEIPSSIEERRAYLDHKIRDSISQVLHLAGPEDVDPKDVMSDLGLDSVLTVSLRSMLQKALGVKVPPTLTWTCPTVVDLICWFESNI